MDGKLRVAFFLSTLLVSITYGQTDPPEEMYGGEAQETAGGAGRMWGLPTTRGGDGEMPPTQRTPVLLQDFISFAQRAITRDTISQQRVANTFTPVQDRPVLLSDFVQFATGALARGRATEGQAMRPTNELPAEQTTPVLLTDLVQFLTTARQAKNYFKEATNVGSTADTKPVLLTDLVQFVENAMKTKTTDKPTSVSLAEPNTPAVNVNSDAFPANSMANLVNEAKAPEKTTTGSADHFNPNNMPLEKFQSWLNNIGTGKPNKPADSETQKPDTQTMTSPEVFWTRNMIIVISVAGGTTLLCIALLTLVCCLRRRSGLSKKERELMEKTFNSRPLNAFSTIGSKGMDLFMGIPANNEIWRDLQTLPKSSSNSSIGTQ